MSSDPDDPDFVDDPDYDPSQASASPSKARRPLKGRASSTKSPIATSRPIRGRPKRSINYDEISSTDEDNNDDKPIDPRLIKAGKYIIWVYEGTHYPALVVRKYQTVRHVRNMLPATTSTDSNTKNWLYGSGQRQCPYDHVKHLISTPIMHWTSSGRGNNLY